MHLMLFKQLFATGLLFLTCYFAAARPKAEGFRGPDRLAPVFPLYYQEGQLSQGPHRSATVPALEHQAAATLCGAAGRPGRPGVKRAFDLPERYPVRANLS